MRLRNILFAATTGLGLASSPAAEPSETLENFQKDICWLKEHHPELFWRRNKSFDNVGNAFVRLGFISNQEQLNMARKFIDDTARRCPQPRVER
jgi:hypothetical protein